MHYRALIILVSLLLLAPAAGANSIARHNAPPSPLAQQQLGVIYQTLCPSGCGDVKLYRNSNVDNALAAPVSRRETHILYNPDWMNDVQRRHGNKATLGILAHEFGHHLDETHRPAWMAADWDKELRADAWAGCFMGRAGITTTGAEAALRSHATHSTDTHPDWQRRVQAVRHGHNACRS